MITPNHSILVVMIFITLWYFSHWVRVTSVTSLERLLLVLVAISSPSRQADLLSIRPENFVILIINGLQNCEIKNLFASFLRATLWLSSPKLKELSFLFPRLLFFLEVRVHSTSVLYFSYGFERYHHMSFLYSLCFQS